jgi:hypothetical protein
MMTDGDLTLQALGGGPGRSPDGFVNAWRLSASGGRRFSQSSVIRNRLLPTRLGARDHCGGR